MWLHLPHFQWPSESFGKAGEHQVGIRFPSAVLWAEPTRYEATLCLWVWVCFMTWQGEPEMSEKKRAYWAWRELRHLADQIYSIGSYDWFISETVHLPPSASVSIPPLLALPTIIPDYQWERVQESRYMGRASDPELIVDTDPTLPWMHQPQPQTDSVSLPHLLLFKGLNGTHVIGHYSPRIRL